MLNSHIVNFIPLPQSFAFLNLAIITTILVSLCPPLTSQSQTAPANQPSATEPETFDNLLNRASQQYEKRLFSQSYATLQDFLIRFVDDPLTPRALKRVFYLLTLCSVQLGKWEEVIQWSEKYQSDPGAGAESWDRETEFWKAVALKNLNRPEDAHKAFLAFANSNPSHPKAPLALQLAGTSLIIAAQWTKAADFFAAYRGRLAGFEAGEAFLQEINCRIEAGQPDQALNLIRNNQPLQIPRPAALQLMILKIADQFLSSKQYRKAIATLLLVSPKSEVILQQETALSAIKNQLANLQRLDPNSLSTQLTRALLHSASKNAKSFAQIPNLDSSVKYRLASAFLSLQRHREAAQILSSMLANMPPDPIVELASDAVIKSFFETKQWEKAIFSSDAFATKFPASNLLPGALILKGQALQELERYDDADRSFDEVLARFPRHELAAHALLLKAFNHIWRENFPQAADAFQDVINRFPLSEPAETALFWKAQAASLSKKWPETIEGMHAYLTAYPDGNFAPEAEFRILFAEHALRHFDASVPLAKDFIEKYPNDPNRPEAFLLLADGLLARGDIPAGLATLLKTPRNSHFREEAWFRIIKVHRLQENLNDMRKAIAAFREEFPNSPRLAESVFWEAWTWRDNPNKQKDVLHSAILKYGTDPAQWGVAEILSELIKLSKLEDNPSDLRNFLARLTNKNNPRSLQIWGLWANSKLDGPKGRHWLIAALPLLDPSSDSPSVMLDIADSLREEGRSDEAANLYTEIRRWNPTSPLNDRVFASLGLLALERNQPQQAISFFERFLRETPASSKLGEVLLRLADALSSTGKPQTAIQYYEKALAEKSTPRQLKAEALLAIGNIHLKTGNPRKAAPYFQRVFVLYNAFLHLATKASIASARAMNALDQPVEAARILLELLDRTDTDPNSPDLNLARSMLSQIPEDLINEAKARNEAARIAESQALEASLQSK